MIFTARGEKPTEPIEWESTTLAFVKYITDSRYRKLPSFFKSWYKPYRCSACKPVDAYAAEPEFSVGVDLTDDLLSVAVSQKMDGGVRRLVHAQQIKLALPNAQLLNALELLLARYVEVAPDPEHDGEVQLARAVIAAAKEAGHE